MRPVISSRLPMAAGQSRESGASARDGRPRVRRRIRGRGAAYAALALLGVHVVLAPQLLGGVFDWGVAVSGVTAILSLAAATFATRAATTPWPRMILLLAGVVLAWTV